MVVLLVSKPVEPPWNDSSKNLVRDLVLGMRRHDAIAFGRQGGARELGRARLEPIHPAGGSRFAPALADQARVLRRLVSGPRSDLWHFFFAPNPRASRVARATSRLRRVPTVQTVCSVPKDGTNLAQVLFADRIVILSQHTAERFAAGGIAKNRLVRIAPSAPPLVPLTPEQRRQARRTLNLDTDAPLVVYPGDLEFGSGARLTLEAHAELPKDTRLVLACRSKTPQAARAEAELRACAGRLGTAARVTFIGDTPRILTLLGAADVVALPSEVAYAKMDYPLVLLEAMALGRPVVTASGTPAAELAAGGAAIAVAPRVDAVAAALGRLISDGAYREELGALARRTALSEYDRTRMAEAYEALYDELG